MTPKSSHWKIATPCTANWDQMPGDDRRRFCEGCGKHVYNVSSMTPKDRGEFAKPIHQHECITYIHRANGTLVDLSLWASLRRRFPALRLVRWSAIIALLPAILTGCVGGRRVSTLGVPCIPLVNQNTQHPNGTESQAEVPDGVMYQTTVPGSAPGSSTSGRTGR